MTRASAASLLVIVIACADPEPVPERSAIAPPDPVAAELAESVIHPRALRPTRDELKAACADPASACALYQALRDGRAVIDLKTRPFTPCTPHR